MISKNKYAFKINNQSKATTKKKIQINLLSVVFTKLLAQVYNNHWKSLIHI